MPGTHRVVVVGGGFGGLSAVRELDGAPVEVTLIDRRNFHLFQPLLYQVATGALSPGEIASPLRAILKRQRNVRVVLAEVADVDLEAREVILGPDAAGEEGARVPYDTLIVAAGAAHAYFGHDEWEPLAPGLKTLEDALEIRRRILVAFEAAELEPAGEERDAWMTFVVVGGGPTGVELAGQIAEIARDTVRRDFREIDPTSARILLVEAVDRVLTAYPERLSERARRQLERLGVATRLDAAVVGVDAGGVTLQGGGGTERVRSRTIIWAAGVAASGLGAALARRSGAELDRAGRITVGPDLTLAGHPEVLVLGDMVRVSDGAGGVLPLPGVAQPAMQEGRYAGRLVRARLAGAAAPAPFHYRDKGNLATIGRRAAVAEIKGVQLWGLPAWLTWAFVHLAYLNGLQNRTIVFLRWCVSFLTRGRGARLITGEGLEAGERPPPGP